MQACLLSTPAPVESAPLKLAGVPIREPGAGEVLVRVRACWRVSDGLACGRGGTDSANLARHSRTSAWRRGALRIGNLAVPARSQGRYRLAPPNLRQIRVLPVGPGKPLREQGFHWLYVQGGFAE